MPDAAVVASGEGLPSAVLEGVTTSGMGPGGVVSPEAPNAGSLTTKAAGARACRDPCLPPALAAEAPRRWRQWPLQWQRPDCCSVTFGRGYNIHRVVG